MTHPETQEISAQAYLARLAERGEKVERPGDLMAALKRGFEAVRSGTPALLSVITQGRDT